MPGDVTPSCEEIFGPVLTLRKVEGKDAAFAAVNDSKYGLQAGVFTHDLRTASARTVRWRSAAWSSKTSPRIAPTRCRTAE